MAKHNKEEVVKSFFLDICEDLKKSSGTVEIIKTSGTNILLNEGERWVNFGTSNLIEIYSDLDHIINLFNNYKDYEDSDGQFMYDIIAILEDLTFHTSIFGVYYSAIEDALSEKLIGHKNASQDKTYKHTNVKNPDYSGLDVIAAKWDLGIDLENKINLIKSIIMESNKAYTFLMLLFDEVKHKNISCQQVCLSRAYSSLLSLQYSLSIIKIQ